MSEHLKNVVDSIINDKPEEAETSFHTYLSDKMRGMISGQEEPASADVEDEVPAPETADVDAEEAEVPEA